MAPKSDRERSGDRGEGEREGGEREGGERERGGGRERGREREGEGGERERQTDRQTDRQPQRDRDRQRQTETDRDRERLRQRQRGRQIDRQASRQTDRQTESYTPHIHSHSLQRQRQTDRQRRWLHPLWLSAPNGGRHGADCSHGVSGAAATSDIPPLSTPPHPRPTSNHPCVVAPGSRVTPVRCQQGRVCGTWNSSQRPPFIALAEWNRWEMMFFGSTDFISEKSKRLWGIST